MVPKYLHCYTIHSITYLDHWCLARDFLIEVSGLALCKYKMLLTKVCNWKLQNQAQLEPNWTSKQHYPLQTENAFNFGQALETCDIEVTKDKVHRSDEPLYGVQQEE